MPAVTFFTLSSRDPVVEIVLTVTGERTVIETPKYDHIIVDTGGRDTTSQRAALAVSQLLLVPFVPRSFDIWTINKVATLVEELRSVNPALAAYVFLNRADPQGQGTENAEAANMLGEIDGLTYLDAPLGSRKAFGHAATQGLAITELTGHHHNPKAADEITALFKRCFNVTSILQNIG